MRSGQKALKDLSLYSDSRDDALDLASLEESMVFGSEVRDTKLRQGVPFQNC